VCKISHKYKYSSCQALYIFTLIGFHFLIADFAHSQEMKISDNTTKNSQYLKSDKLTYGETVSKIDNQYRLIKKIVRHYPDSALSIGKKIKKLSTKISYAKGILKSNEIIARANVLGGSYEKGIEIALQNLESAKKIKDDNLYLNFINILGQAYHFKKEIHNVYRYNQKGLAHAKETNCQNKVNLFLANAGLLMFSIEEYDKCQEYLDACLKNLKAYPDSVRLTQVMNTLGDLHYRKGNYVESKKYFSKSIELAKKINSITTHSLAHIKLGYITLEEEKVDEAREHFNDSKKILADSKDLERVIETNLGLAHLEFNLKNYEISKSIAIDALINSKKSNLYSGIADASKLLHDIFSIQNNYEEGYAYLKTHAQIKDSLNLIINNNKVRTMLVEQDMQKDKELVELRMNQQIANQKLYNALAIAISIVLALIIIFLRDILRKRKKLIKQLSIKTKEQEKSKNELEELHQTKDKLFSILSHDLKGPIISFKNLLDLYTTGEITLKEFTALIPKVTKELNYLHFTMKNILTWANNQFSGTSKTTSNIDLRKLVNINFNLIRTRADEKSISLINLVEENVFVWSDYDQTDIIIRNLISNALKFTKANGSITVNADEMVNCYTISVEDTGIGMNYDTQKKLFTENSTITTYGTANEKGTGIGLSICKEMVEKNHGEIWVSSELNVGTCFKFTLPKSREIYSKAAG